MPSPIEDGARLIPAPRSFHYKATLPAKYGVRVVAGSNNREDRFAANDLQTYLNERGVRGGITTKAPRIVLLRDTNRKNSADGSFHEERQEEGYTIACKQNSLYVTGHSAAGIFYGVQTVKQLLQGYGKGAALTCAEVEDWPAMRYRGVHDDLSRGPIPTLEYQRKQIRTLAAYKVNVYSPYFERTFAYQKEPLAGLPGGAMTAQEAEELTEYAARYHVSIVPEQEAFGHLHHLLTFEQYSDLGETRQGTVLAPGNAGALPLIEDWFRELSEAFAGTMLHIGADETNDLGRGQTKAEVQVRGLGHVYIDFLSKIHDALKPLNRRLLFWGDIALREPSLIGSIPKDMIAVSWEYAPYPSYDRWITPYTRAGMETWVAPGVSNWNRVYPDYAAAFQNIRTFTSDGQRLGAIGQLNTIWNDDGEGLFEQDWYGVLFGASAAWEQKQVDVKSFQQAYGRVFHQDEQGLIDQAQQELTAASALLDTVHMAGMSNRLFWLDPWSPAGVEAGMTLKPILPQVRLHSEHALELLAHARQENYLRELDALEAMDLGARRMDFIGLKFEVADLVRNSYAELLNKQSITANHNDIARELWILSGIYGRLRDLRDGYSYIQDEYRAAWLKENRPYWLENIEAHYNLCTQLWIRRADQLEDVRLNWIRHKPLPPAGQLGMPAENGQ